MALAQSTAALWKRFAIQALCSATPFMAKTLAFYRFHYSRTPHKENKAVHLGSKPLEPLRL